MATSDQRLSNRSLEEIQADVLRRESQIHSEKLDVVRFAEFQKRRN